MSRLQTHQRKQIYLQLVFYIGLLIVVLVLIFTFGIKLLINGSLFVDSISKSNQSSEVKTNREDFVGLFRFDNPLNATGAATIIVTGTVTNYDGVDFFLNGELVKTITPQSDGFSEEIGPLQPGKNQLYAVARSKSQKRNKTSDTFTIVYKNQKPKLEINQPTDNSTTSSQEISVSGTTDPETYIHINGAPVVVDAQSRFEITIKLNNGENKIEIVAEDIVGNQNSKTLIVNYQLND